MYNENVVQSLEIYLHHERVIWDKYTNGLVSCLQKREKKGLLITKEHLAGCSPMQKMLTEAARLTRADGLHVSSEDRREASMRFANYLVNEYTKQS